MSGAATDLNQFPPEVAASVRVQMPPAADAGVSDEERKAEAERFLTLLDEDADVFCFQTFDDLDSRKSPKLAAVEHGTLDSLWSWLDAKNKNGAGIFVTINEVEAGAARTIPNVVRVRAVFADFDPPKTAPAPAKYPLPPAWQVESSPGKRHAYWPVDGLPLADFQPLMKTVIAALGSDPAPNDLPRVMRLPGFFHMKNPAAPHLVRLIDVDDRLPYRPEQIAAAFGAPCATPAAPAQPSIRKGQEDYLAGLLDGEDVHNNALRIVGRMVATGFRDEDIHAMFSVLSKQVAEIRGADRAKALTGSELQRMIDGARAKGYGPPPPIDPSALIANAAAFASAPAETLALGEVERLLSWAWATGYTLPADPPGLFQSAADAAGNRSERLRVPLGVGGYQAPWASIAWRSGPVQFMEGVHEYLPRRVAVVERKDAERIAKGKEPQGDIDEASLLEHASQWLARVRALQVPDEEGKGLLSRIATGEPGTPTAPLRVERVTEEDRQAPVPPEELFALTGALRALYDHYAASARYRQPWFGVAAATATVAAVIGRSYAFRGTYANHMNVMVGPTGCGKDAPQALCEAALTAAGLSARIGPGSFASGAGIEDHMSHAPVTLWVLDELGKLLGSIGAGDQARAADIAGKLMRLYSASGRTYVGRALASHVRGEAPQPIRVINPITCVLGASTPEAMASALSAGDLESGLIGRLLFFVTHDVRPVRSEPSVSIEDIPEDFVAWARVAGPERMGGNLPGGAPTVKPDPPLSVLATLESSALLSVYADEIDDRLRALRDPAAISGVVRAAETASKFAMIAAVSDDPEAPLITERHVRWGIAMSRHLSLSFTRAFADRIGGNPQHDALLRVRDLVFRARDFTGAHYRSATRNGLMPRAYLVKLSKLRARELNDVLGTLAEMGEVSSGIAKRSTHGHEGVVYWPTIAERVEVEA
jgi:hypothetical protein